MKLTKLLFLPISSIAVIPCVSLTSCSNAIGVKNVSAELYYLMSKQYAEGIELILEYVNNVAEARSGDIQATINGSFAKVRVNGNSIAKCIDKYKHLEISASATMIDGTHYLSTIELDGYYNYAIDNYNYLTEIKNVKIVNW